MTITSPRLALAAAALVAVLAPSTSDAVVYGQNGTDACDANLPEDDIHLRRTPTFIKNVSSTGKTVVVTCSLGWVDDVPERVETASIWIRNDNATARDVKCTAVLGSSVYGTLSVTKTLTVASGDRVPINFHAPADFTQTKKTANFNCVLPKGTSIHEVAFLASVPT